MNDCTNCIYEYRCDWSKADENLTCPDWKHDGSDEKTEVNKDVVSKIN